ncbi:MAG: TetR/AcrR family transcriptional regulator [Desulfobacterales bacterium]|nr:TetR/AcrR family transcriptional regulator [Desulfobacterales bacterium]
MTASTNRMTQQQRRRRMRGRLIDATLDCLEDYGYHGASLSRILDRAGVSRGAWRHHYSSKKELIAAAARERLFEGAIETAREMAPELTSETDRLAPILDFIWERFYQGRYRNIWVELMVACRSDTELRAALIPLFHDLVDAMDEIWRVHFRTTATESVSVETLMNLTLYLINGMGLQSILHDNSDYYKTLRDQWTKMLTPLVQVRTHRQ